MSDVPARSGPSASSRWALVYVLLVPAVVLPLWVGLYDREDPTFLGFPFYYWFQFLLIPVVSALTFAAFRISEAATRRDREERRP
jgi:hypothetical protein